MSYSTVLSLDDAKAYLRVSHDDSDSEISRMIKSALEIVEIKTNQLLYQRATKTYTLYGGCVRIYDGPINTSGVTGLATTVTRTDYRNYSLFEDSNEDNTSVILDVGYTSASSVPRGLLDAALEMIDYWYYKNDGKVSIMLMPESVEQVLGMHTRFLI